MSDIRFVVAPTYVAANAWARQHDVPRSKMRVLTQSFQVWELPRGSTVALAWPAGVDAREVVLRLHEAVVAGDLQLDSNTLE